MKLPNFIVRVLAGAVFVAILLAGLLANEFSFAGVFAIFAALSLYEFYDLMEKAGKVPLSKWGNAAGGTILFCSAFLYFSGLLPSLLIFAPYIIYLQVLFVGELFLKKGNAVQSLAYSTLGQVYAALPFAMANILVFSFSENYTSLFLLAVLVLIWVNDSFAYLTGITLGRHKMFERISPKKSWEGFVGGTCFAVAASMAFYHFTGLYTIPVWMGLAAVIVVSGTLGDLIESLIKRTLAVKDSGKIIPGHGGLLDRFDSTIFAIPAVVVYLLIVHELIF